MNKDLAILVSSCDRYSDLWSPFFGMFFKHWKNCPYDIYLCAESLKFPDSRVKTINPSAIQTWSEMLLGSLEKIDQKYVLLMLEDYLLLKDVDNQRIKACFDVLVKSNASCLRLIGFLGPDKDFENDIGIVSKGRNYRVSTQASIWDKKVLQSLLRKEESAWDFEIKGTERSNLSDDLFLCVKEDEKGGAVEEGDYPLTYYCTAVHRGKWRREAVTICKNNSIAIDLKARPQESYFEMYKRIIRRKL